MVKTAADCFVLSTTIGAFLGEVSLVGEFPLVRDWTYLGDVCTEEGCFLDWSYEVTYKACLDGEGGLEDAWAVVLA